MSKLVDNQVSDTPVVTQDWHATFLELAGTEPDPDRPLDGVSLVGHLLGGRPAPERDLFWRMRGSRALRRGDLKYYQGADGVAKLFDLATDAREPANLAAKWPDDLAALKAAWEDVNATLLPY
ncbi:hypothetical protein [Nocardioides speluncae]|uniref:hypothetical protein n=1 Tax=Nocardioides speluncae TaxID=2670337 RepID=UPI000D68A283|nr:hypothetical protein [Nocardioides speluncae]